MHGPLERAREELAARLRARRGEIEQATLTRVYGVSEPTQTDPEYLHGLRAAISAALDYAVEAIELGEERSPPIPTALLGQARLAARNGVGMDTVLRRYLSGFMLFNDFVLQEAEAQLPLRGTSLHRLLQAQSAQFDQMVTAIAEEYGLEAASHRTSSEQRRTERVERLLAGEPLDASELAYDFAGWHVGIVLEGEERNGVLKIAAESLDRRLLRVCPQEGTTWAWFGGRQRVESAEIVERIRGDVMSGSKFAIGEPAKGLAGWRLTHSQARNVLPVGRHRREEIVRYADVGLLACVLKDEVLVRSLHEIYLAPLSDERDGGEALRETLRAYFATGRNVTSAAAALGLSRQTVTTRIRAIEEKLGRALAACGAEIEVALRLEDDCGFAAAPTPRLKISHDLTVSPIR